jgi:hypothetical protein
MVAADIYGPGQWSSFFILVGTGAVTLTGLVFVAMALNLKVIAVDATHRYRAINTLTGLALVSCAVPSCSLASSAEASCTSLR